VLVVDRDRSAHDSFGRRRHEHLHRLDDRDHARGHHNRAGVDHDRSFTDDLGAPERPRSGRG
jgi:hypothetical protein